MTERGHRRLFAIAALALLPWTVIVYRGGVQFVAQWGILHVTPLHVVLLWDYLFRFTMGPASLPPRLLTWPVGALFLAGALLSAAVGAAFDREDRRVTQGLLVLAAIAHLQVWWGLFRLGEVAVPLGPPVALLLAWWDYTVGL